MAHKVVVRPHNDLLSLAHYHRGVINKKHAEGNQEALGLDCLSAIIALAFSVEAILNVVGEMKVSGWRERAPYHEKLNMLATALGFTIDPQSSPFLVLEILKELRDQLAHGQPIYRESTESTREEMSRDMGSPWDEYANPSFVNQAGDAVDELYHMLLELSGIDAAEILTEGSGKFTET